MQRFLTLLILGSLVTLQPTGASGADDIKPIVTDFDAFSRAQDPVRAAQRGDAAAARIWPDNSPAAVAARRSALQQFERRLQALPPTGLGEEDALNRDLLLGRVQLALDGFQFDEERLNFISGDGFYTTADYAALNTPLHSPADAEAWIARLEALPAYYDRETANLRRGIKTRFTQPRRTVERAIEDVRGQLAQPAATTPLLAPFRNVSRSFPPGQLAGFEARANAVLAEKVKPAQQALLAFLEREYLPAARPGIGIGTLPQGKEYYAYLARRHTSTTLSPAEIHALGEREVQRIRARMDEAIAQTGFKGSIPEFLAAVRKDSRFYVDAAEYGRRCAEVAKRADFAMPKYFGRLPRLSYGVMPIPAGLESSANGYLPGTPEQGVAGMVVYKPWMAEKMPTFGIPAWVLHEGVPGHHHQIALSQELTDLPEFRRADDVTAFVEGWGLYSEYLGEEMGIYRDPYEQFGRLSLEMWRACRLVIDTGMHVMGWSRDRAMACLQENSALAPAEIEFEVDRYIAWPAQALAYKVGERKLIELRERAAQRLGTKFDVREFHDVVLGAGPMPLDQLEKRVERWSEARGRQ
ncbi:MAG: DUF885 domain-containing protein [Gammaproteobacteria bacterium]|nr:DUF885 domain-containing protein [Gammaproteobacteria bacterium]MDH5177494.1 DUF885 domain-containing protein [Gammaproteobacteria bacterium]